MALGLDAIDEVVQAFYRPTISGNLEMTDEWLRRFPEPPPYEPTDDGIPRAWSPYFPSTYDEGDW